MNDDFSKKHPNHGKVANPVRIDHEKGEIIMDGSDPLPLAGEHTSGEAYEHLKRVETEQAIPFMRDLWKAMHDLWLCPQCKLLAERNTSANIQFLYDGKQVLYGVGRDAIGIEHRFPKCPRPGCESPLISTAPPGEGRIV